MKSQHPRANHFTLQQLAQNAPQKSSCTPAKHNQHCTLRRTHLHDLHEVPVVLTAQHHVTQGVHVAGVITCAGHT